MSQARDDSKHQKCKRDPSHYATDETKIVSTKFVLRYLSRAIEICLLVRVGPKLAFKYLTQDKSKRAICQQEIWLTETIVNNSCAKTIRKYQVLLDFDKIGSEINKFSTKRMKDITLLRRRKLYLEEEQRETNTVVKRACG